MEDLSRPMNRPPVNLNAAQTCAVSANLSLLTSKRVSVLVEGDVVPLLPGCPTLDSTRSPWKGLYLEEHNLPAIPIPDHEHGTFVLHLQMNERVEMDWHSFGRTGHQITGAGNLILLSPGTRDRLHFHGPTKRIVMSVDPLLIKEASGQLELPGMPEFRNLWTFQDEQLRRLILDMEREMSTGWELGSLYGDLLSNAFVIALIKKYGKALSDTGTFKGGLSRPKLRHVLSYIDEHFSRDIRLRELAGIAGISDYHFARSFRQSTGLTPYQYVLQIRINRAKSLLLQPQWTILPIALAVGFSDASRFIKVFRAHAGVSPSEWRRNS
jgi:AraC family transcriptional regulator